MSKETVTARNKVDGSVGIYPEHIVTHPVFGKHLEVVPHGTKPRVSLSSLVATPAPPSEPEEFEEEEDEDDI